MKFTPPKLKLPPMWIRFIALAVSLLVVRRAESRLVKELNESQTDDLLRRVSADPAMPRWARFLARGPWLYRRLPIDFVPDAIPFIGRLDDKLITSISLNVLARLSPRVLFVRHVEAVHPGSAKDRVRRWFSR